MVSIIILVRDDIGFITRCVESILKHTRTNYEFIFVAQAVSKPVEDYLMYVPHNSTIIHNQTNTGVTPGRNTGILASHGDHLLFFDDDAFISEELDKIPEELHSLDWLGRMLLEYEKEGVGVTGQSGSYVNPETPGMFWECTERHCECDVVQGYCFMFSKEVVSKCGILDDAFGKFWHEESEYALRAKYNGFKVINTRYIGVSHAGSGSGDDGTYGQKIAYMFKKWGPHFNQILTPRADWNKV